MDIHVQPISTPMFIDLFFKIWILRMKNSETCKETNIQVLLFGLFPFYFFTLFNNVEYLHFIPSSPQKNPKTSTVFMQVSELSILYHCLFFCQYHIVLVAVALQEILKVDSGSSATWFFFSIVLVILVHLPFCVNFRVSSLISTEQLTDHDPFPQLLYLALNNCLPFQKFKFILKNLPLL